ncbi:MAG TPA: NusG domain II-containing protein [Oscillospiraceae bacterium]|nr:NusG domain II-containing protein [Oscillospiraceae bacterium]
MERRGFRRGDAVAVAAVLLLAALSVLLLPARSAAGGTAVVSVNGVEVLTVSLSGEARDIALSDLPYPMTLHVENGTISVLESACPGKDCVRQGAISRNGESIVCLPNRVTIVIESTTPSGLDGVAG